MNNLGAGDLAIVIKTFHDHSALGKSVTLLKLTPPEGVFYSPISGDTRCSVENNYAWVCLGDVYSGNDKDSEYGWALFLPEQLMKISPDNEFYCREDKKDSPMTVEGALWV